MKFIKTIIALLFISSYCHSQIIWMSTNNTGALAQLVQMTNTECRETIIGAFGIKLGATIDGYIEAYSNLKFTETNYCGFSCGYGVSKPEKYSLIYKFTPTDTNDVFTEYYVLVTPKSHIIYEIYAIGNWYDTMFCDDKEDWHSVDSHYIILNKIISGLQTILTKKYKSLAGERYYETTKYSEIYSTDGKTQVRLAKDDGILTWNVESNRRCIRVDTIEKEGNMIQQDRIAICYRPLSADKTSWEETIHPSNRGHIVNKKSVIIRYFDLDLSTKAMYERFEIEKKEKSNQNNKNANELKIKTDDL